MNPLSSRPFQTLRQFLRSRPEVERCELCSQELPADHPHLLDLSTGRRILCSCRGCALLFEADGARYRRIPTEVECLADFQMSDAQWESLSIPISLAFFFHDTRAGHIVAQYPSPGGATEASLPLDAWHELAEQNPVLANLRPDVEVLLVNRMGTRRDHYRVPIDECYKLVGLIRSNWRGLSGGTEVQEIIARFFSDLQQRSLAKG